MPTPESTRRDRAWFPEVEALKAAAIVAVVFVHAGRPWWHPGRSRLERWIELFTMAGVPCFLFCSGFLQAGRVQVGWDVTRSRLARLVGPYVLASFLAQLFRLNVLGAAVAHPLRELLLGDAFGAYYFVFVIVTLTLCVPVLSRLPRPMLWLVVAFFVCTGAVRSLAQWMPEIERELVARGREPPGDFRMAVRSPLLSWGYFLVGYALRPGYGRLVDWLVPRRKALGFVLWGVTLAVFGALAFAEIARWQFLSYPLVYLLIASFGVTWFGRAEPLGAGTRFLARHTYLVYLYHLFFVLGVQRLWPQPAHGFRLDYYALYVTVGLGAPLCVAWLAERSLPVPLRSWLGVAAAPAT